MDQTHRPLHTCTHSGLGVRRLESSDGMGGGLPQRADLNSDWFSLGKVKGSVFKDSLNLRHASPFLRSLTQAESQTKAWSNTLKPRPSKMFGHPRKTNNAVSVRPSILSI